MPHAPGKYSPQPNVDDAPTSPDFSIRFWLLVVLVGTAAGLAAGLLMKLLRLVQHLAWAYRDGSFLEAVEKASAPTRVGVLAGAGVLVALVLFATSRATASKHTGELEATIWFNDGRLPPVRTSVKAILSIVIVALGASLGREAAPKQVGALIGSLAASWGGMPAARQRLLAACGAGSGLAAVYNVPLGGALFTLEVLLGTLAFPLVAPAFLATLCGTAAAWVLLPNEPTYAVPAMPLTPGLLVFALLFGPIAGTASALFVALVARAARLRPKAWTILPIAPLVFAGVGMVAIAYPQVLGNGKGIVELAALGRIDLPVLAALVLLKPLVTLACLGTGAPGGLFTPTLAFGAVLGGALGQAWLMAWPGTPAGAFALVGAAAVLAGTTKGPVSSIVLLLELTRHIDGLMVPLLIAVALATLVAHRLNANSTYTTRLKPPGSLRERVIAAGVEKPGETFEAVSSGARYDDLMAVMMRNPTIDAVHVVDDAGDVAGAVSRAAVLMPSRAMRPLEIATAIDFVREARRATP